VAGVQREQAETVVAALRERGMFAHVRSQGLYRAAVRVVLPEGREAIWDSDGAAGLEAQVMSNGVLVGFVPTIPGSEDWDTASVVEAIAAETYA
jgi:hypothetical protein